MILNKNTRDGFIKEVAMLRIEEDEYPGESKYQFYNDVDVKEVEQVEDAVYEVVDEDGVNSNDYPLIEKLQALIDFHIQKQSSLPLMLSALIKEVREADKPTAQLDNKGFKMRL